MADIEKAENNTFDNARGSSDGNSGKNSAHPGHWATGPGHTPFRTKIGNPGGLGLFSFASTTFILSLYNLQARGIQTPNVVVGMALFCGGLGQLLAGMWEFPRGNQFGGTAFTSYGVFWMSYAVILIPGSGVQAAYTNSPPGEFEQALGIYLMTWFVLTSLLLIAALRRNMSFIFLLLFLALTYLLLAIGQLTGNVHVTKAGGGTGIVAAWIAYYAGLSELLIREESFIMLPLGTLPRRVD